MLEWYNGLAERERRFVLYGAIGAVIVILVGVIWPLYTDIAEARGRIATKQADLAYIQSVTPQLLAAGPSTSSTPAGSLVVLIDSSARESGLGKSLTNSQPTPNGGLRIRLDHVPFDGLVAWLSRLAQQQGIRVESAEIETSGEAGYVNAGLVLRSG
jgi:type II secretory pathway component PulM